MFFDMRLYAHGAAPALLGKQLKINRDEIESKVRHMADLLEKNGFVRTLVLTSHAWLAKT
jgi:hypothetical protein